MKRCVFLILLVALGAVAQAAMTNSASYIVDPRYSGYNNSDNTSLNRLYLFCNEAEGLLEGTGNFPSLRILESTGATYYTTLSCGDQSANLTFKLPTGAGTNGQVLSTNGSGTLSWTNNAGTFTGGNITSDVVLNADGVDILTDTTTAHTFAVRGYADAGTYKDILRITNGAAVTAVVGASDVVFSLASTGLDVSTAGVLTNVGGLTGTGTFSINDSATTNTTSIGGGTTTGAVNIGTGASAQTLGFGTGGGAKAVTVGSTNTTSQTDLNSGSNGLNLNVSNNQATNINTGTSTGTVSIGTGATAQTVTLGNGAGAKTVALGSGTGTSTTTILGGSNGVNLNASNNAPTNINTGTSNGAVTIGGGSGTVAVVSSDWGITTAGNMSNIGTIGADGLITATGGATITGAAVNLNASSNFAVNIATGTTNTATTIGGGSGTVEIASTGLDVSTAGALTNAVSVAGTNSNTMNLAINNRFEFTDNSETFGFDVGTTSNTAKLCTDSGVDTIDCNNVDKFTGVNSITGDNGAKVDVSMDERVEFKDGAESYGFLLSGANTIVATTDTGATDFDMNDIDRLIGVEYVTGDLGVKADLSMNERVEFKDGAESFGFLLSGANKISLTTDSLATELDMNDVDQLTGVEFITGDNGNKLDFSINERFEFGDTEKFGFALGTGNTVELVTDTGVTIVDFNDVDQLTDVESITGDGAGSISGFILAVTNDAEPHAILTTESGKVLTNLGSDGSDAWTLPAAAAGLHYTFVVAVNQQMRITPAAGDKINHAGTLMDAAEYYWADLIGETLTLVAVDTTNWVVTSSTGTWTEQTP